jgi:trehalose-6-phosphate synthase/HAMP domain-containing protein
VRRILLIFILPLLIIITVVFAVFGIVQVRSEEKNEMDDLRRKAQAVAESIELSARYILVNRDMATATRLVNLFQKRERLQGCAIYDANGTVLAITERFAGWKPKDIAYFKDKTAKNQAADSLQKFEQYYVYSYVLPVAGDANGVIGAVEVIYDTSYMFSDLFELWKRIGISLIVLVVLIFLTALLIQWRIFILPVNRLTDWFRRFQKGETDSSHPIAASGELGRLASEVEQVALNLRIARKAASDEASERIHKEDIWTEAKLRDLIRAKLGDNAFFVVSNREPYMHSINKNSGLVQCIRPAGGVVTAIDPILRASGGTWIAHGSGDADRRLVNSKNRLGVPPEDNRYILRRVWLSKEQEQGYYYGFANEGLWPLCHITYVRPIFRESDWQMYKDVNQIFADVVAEELPAKSPFVFIQDYHFTLLGKMIKERRPDATVALFWHIPWPNPEVLAICPYHKEILDGMLGCDLLGFHVQYHCNNFLDTANRLLESRIDTEKFSVVRSNKETFVRAFPISVDGYIDKGLTAAQTKRVQQIREELDLADKIVGVGVERIDYTKGIKERILAIDRFLEKYPEYKRKFVFIQLAAPSRTHIKSYHDLMAEIDELVERKNWKYSEGDWKPIIYMNRHFSSEEIRPYYELADICIVSSLHDGMNLVAKEFVAARPDLNCTLILSNLTGASRELTSAVQINPYSIEEFADAIKFAIEMPDEEKQKRMEHMRNVVRENNVYRWAANIITELTALKKI